MRQFTARSKEKMTKLTTSESIHLMDLEHVPEEVMKRGHTKAYSAKPVNIPKLSVRRKKDE